MSGDFQLKLRGEVEADEWFISARRGRLSLRSRSKRTVKPKRKIPSHRAQKPTASFGKRWVSVYAEYQRL